MGGRKNGCAINYLWCQASGALRGWLSPVIQGPLQHMTEKIKIIVGDCRGRSPILIQPPVRAQRKVNNNPSNKRLGIGLGCTIKFRYSVTTNRLRMATASMGAALIPGSGLNYLIIAVMDGLWHVLQQTSGCSHGETLDESARLEWRIVPRKLYNANTELKFFGTRSLGPNSTS